MMMQIHHETNVTPYYAVTPKHNTTCTYQPQNISNCNGWLYRDYFDSRPIDPIFPCALLISPETEQAKQSSCYDHEKRYSFIEIASGAQTGLDYSCRHLFLPFYLCKLLSNSLDLPSTV
jgi:hypothetical protein